MKRIKVLKNGIVTHQLDEDHYLKYGGQSIDAWLAEQIAADSFGKADRWLSEHDVKIQGLSEQDAIDRVEVPGPLGKIKMFKFKAEYEVVEEDITAEVAAQEAAKERKKLLIKKIRKLKKLDLATLDQVIDALLELAEVTVGKE